MVSEPIPGAALMAAARSGRIGAVASLSPSRSLSRASGLTSERADGEVAQPQVGELALLPQTEQTPVQGLAQGVVAAADRNADALAEIAALGEGTALERAAPGGIGSVEPERERDAVAEQEIDLAAPQRFAR